MDDDEQDTLVTIFQNIESEKLSFCLDLCHWQSSENVWGSSLKVDKLLLNNLKNVHFSMTLEKDGYKNKARTHGRGHDCMKSCIRDLEYLRKKGIGLEDINLVTEINEEDYKRRPVMHKELYYLWGIRLKCRKVKGVCFDECRKVKIKRVS
jgi:nucleosome binding factor SPN SPT16 subunit